MRRATMAVFGLCLLAGSLQAQGLFGERAEAGEMPGRFVRVEGFAFGDFVNTYSWPGMHFRVAGATCVLGRFRAGVSLLDLYGVVDSWMSGMVAPVSVGATIWSNPKKTWFCYGFTPDVYAEVGGSLWNTGFVSSPTARAAICCDADYYGLGLRLETGWLNIETPAYPERRTSILYAGFQFRVLTFGIGF